MHEGNDRDLFAPAAPPGRKRAIALAVLAHLALIGALTWGVRWKASSDQPAVEAELWSAVPQQAAPRPTAPPPPPPAPAPEPQPTPTPAPPPPQQAQPQPSEADIALEREKKRQEQEKIRQAQLEQQKRERLDKERREQEEQKKQALAAQQQKEKAEREKAEREKAAKAAEQEKQRKLAEEKRKAQAEERLAEEFRREQLKRNADLAGATGADNATGSAQKSSGPSGSYGGKVAAKVKPNIVYPDTLPGNPRAEVEVRAAPDGTIVGVRLTKPSGSAAWDDAVVRALYKTETLPRDVDGRVPSSLVIGFRPKD